MGAEVMLHGDLNVTIHRGENIPNLETLGLGLLGRGIAKLGGLSVDPYVNIKLGGVKIASTATIDGDLNPNWHEQFVFHVCHNNVSELHFEVKDKNTAGATLLGECKLSLQELLTTQRIDGPQPLYSTEKKITKGKLFVTVTYTACESENFQDPAVPRVYFKPHEGNSVRFYSCSHSLPQLVPPVDITAGTTFQVHSCWSDVYDSITSAQKFVYLTGWSFHPLIPLIRDASDPAKSRPLGELLKEASERGCEVCMLVWDDRSSLSFPGVSMFKKGLMNTHDEVTRGWFAQNAPRVRCQLVGRSGDQKQSFVEDGSGARLVKAFVGGLDLTKGRYDTPEHPLYPPDNRFEDDFRQPSYDCESGKKPKQPWQDIHCSVVGPLARDVVANFTERWEKQAAGRAGNLLPPENMGCVYAPSTAPDAFCGQVLRSIDSRSADFATGSKVGNLFQKKGRSVDDSIYRGYIHHIRRAERFLYIENQYFLGSCYMWSDEQASGCSHTVVAELVQRIVRKIHAGQEFTAYILIFYKCKNLQNQPLFPEGDPYGGPVSAILKFQKYTMEAMYSAVDKALKEAGSDKDPQDYLQFLCLGKRVAGPMEGPNEGGKGKAGIMSHRHRRFMVYVHSKLLIVDDDVALVGSANINMRSLAGTRDTEIAAVLWQPAYMRQLSPGTVTLPKGQVHGFRMSLWKEHLGNVTPEMEDIMRDPGSLACSRLVRNCAQVNWDTFINPAANNATPGHLMSYPIRIVREHGVSLEPLSELIPDFPGANMFGGPSDIPYVLTT